MLSPATAPTAPSPCLACAVGVRHDSAIRPDDTADIRLTLYRFICTVSRHNMAEYLIDLARTAVAAGNAADIDASCRIDSACIVGCRHDAAVHPDEAAGIFSGSARMDFACVTTLLVLASFHVPAMITPLL